MMIDIHCHIVPSIDDGSKNIETSIEMAKIAYEDGIRKIIATPHFYRNHFENSFEDVVKQVSILKHRLKEEGIDIEILSGQEIFLDDYILDDYKKGIIKPLIGKQYMLMELDFEEIPKHALDIMYELKILGISIIIAHPERYSYIRKNIYEINLFIQEGCLFQINAGSIMGLYGKEIQKTSRLLVENGICDFIASDAHSTGRRKPQLSECYTWVKGSYPEVYESVIKNAENLIEGKKIEVKHKSIEKKKGLFSKIFGRK